MKTRIAVAMALALTFAGAQMASAQPGHYVEHKEWHKGARIGGDDWKRGQPVDYRAHHLRRPPHGYEWRQVDGNYVMAAVAGGVIGAMIAGH